MPPKRKGRKGAAAVKKTRSRKEKDPLYEKKKLILESCLAKLDQDVENHCNSMKEEMVSTCGKLEMLYQTSLLTIPKECRSMTKAQYMEKMRNKESDMNKAASDGIAKLVDLPSLMSRFENCRATTAKKKQRTKKIFSSPATKVLKDISNTSIVNSSIASTSKTFGRTTRQALAKIQADVTPLFRQHGVPLNCTPKVKSSAFNARPVVTPKFDLRKPLNSSLLRKPRAGEIVMSMSGSPLQVPSVDVPSKPGIILSLGGGKMINVTDPSSLGEIKDMGNSTRHNLNIVRDQLTHMLAIS